MNPFREPGENEVELERARLHEEAETQRERIRQAEETKRKQIQARGDGWMIPWCILGALAFSGIIATGVLWGKHMERTGPCSESSEVITSDSLARSCPAGAKQITEKVGENRILVRCVCSSQ